MRVPFRDFIEREIDGDAVLITCGLPATNKTETAEVIARIKGYTILRTDMIRKEILKGEDIFDEKVASDMNKRALVYDRMFEMAHELATRGKGVILDATFIKRSLRRRAAKVAARAGKTLIIQQTSAPEAYSLEKISKRTKENYESNALTPEAYHNNKKSFEPVDLDALKADFPDLGIMHLVVDTASDSEDGWYVIEQTIR